MHRPVVAAILFGIACPAGAVGVANTTHDRLMKSPVVIQRAAMRQAITNNGLRCGRVDAARFQQPWKNLMMWTATCTPGGAFAVYIGSDATVQARRCEEAAGLKLPLCRR